jgi:hypothetical protein
MNKLKLISIALLLSGTAYGVDNPFSSLTALGNNLAAGDLFAVTDISDTTQSVNGTTKKIVASDVGLFFISDTAWSGSVWNGITGIAPSKNAVYDYLHLLAAADDGKVSQLNTTAAGFVPTNASGVIGTARVITAGTAVSVTNGDGSAGNPTINFDPTGLTGNRTWSAGGSATLVWTFDLSGTDPVLTIGSGVFNVTTGSLQVSGVDVATISGSQILTNKTFDGSATGNVLKFKSYPQFTSPLRVDGTNTTIGTTATTLGYGLATFSGGSVAASANWAEFRILVPNDLDNTVEPRVRIADLLTGADTNTRRYVVTLTDVASSASATPSPSATVTNVDIVDASGASGDVDISSYTSCAAGTAAALTPGHLLVLRVARDSSSGTDTSTVNSTLLSLELEYAASQ